MASALKRAASRRSMRDARSPGSARGAGAAPVSSPTARIAASGRMRSPMFASLRSGHREREQLGGRPMAQPLGLPPRHGHRMVARVQRPILVADALERTFVDDLHAGPRAAGRLPSYQTHLAQLDTVDRETVD